MIRTTAALLSTAILLAACGTAKNPQPPYGVEWGEEIRDAKVKTAVVATPTPTPTPTPAPDPQVVEARTNLSDTLETIGEEFGGSMGIAVVDVDTGWSTGFNETTFLPQQSVSKTWVTLTALEMAEKGLLDLDRPIRVSREDLTLFHQPIRERNPAQRRDRNHDWRIDRARYPAQRQHRQQRYPSARWRSACRARHA